MSFIPAMTTGAGAIMAPIGAYQTGKEQEKAYQYNAQLYEQRAQSARQTSAMTQFQKDRQTKVAIGSQRAAFAKAGVNINTGSPIQLMVDSLYNAELYKAIGAYNDEVEAKSYENAAAMNRYYGKQAKREGMAKAGISLLKSAADYDVKYGKKKTKIGEGE